MHGRRVLVFTFALGDQDEEEQQDQQATDGDTHSNQAGLVGRELVVVFGTGSVGDNMNTVGVGVDGFSVRGSDLEDDVIFDTRREIQWATLPDLNGESKRSLHPGRIGGDEALNVGMFESRVRSAALGGGGSEASAIDNSRGGVLGDDGDLILEIICVSGRFSSGSS